MRQSVVAFIVAALCGTLFPRPASAGIDVVTFWNSTNECVTFGAKGTSSRTRDTRNVEETVAPGGHRARALGMAADKVTVTAWVHTSSNCASNRRGAQTQVTKVEGSLFKNYTWNFRLLGGRGDYHWRY